VSQIPKSVVREIRTLRSGGVGTTFMVVPSTRRVPGNRHPYCDRNYAYVADMDYRLEIIDISNPAIPSHIGGCDLSGEEVNDVVVSGSYAYVADSDSGFLEIIDLLP